MHYWSHSLKKTHLNKSYVPDVSCRGNTYALGSSFKSASVSSSLSSEFEFKHLQDSADCGSVNNSYYENRFQESIKIRPLEQKCTSYN